MFQYLKYLPKILFGFQDVSDVYKAETGENRPWYYSRTFIFSALCFISTLATIFFGITFNEDQLKIIAENVPTLITTLVAIIGAIMSFVAQFKSKKNGK
jgi:hypothetical protein